MALLDAYRPDVDGPWTHRQAAHLLRRSGFAPAADEVAACLAAGPAMTVDRLLTDRTESPRFLELDPLGESLAAAGQLGRLAGWWMARLVHTRRPLAARLVLLWHNVFATSNEKVNAPPLMLRQLRTFEALGLGRYRELLLAMARDPAMIVWLDGDSNLKGRPNENFARELFELFTLGPGHYSEQDIREAARAFSGWQQRAGAFHFNAREHDAGEKHVLGGSGRLDGGDVIDLALRQPAAARFLARRLVREFVSDAPPDALVEALAAVLRDSEFDIAAAIRTLLVSRAFFDPSTERGRIKSPVEFVVGLVRSWSMRTTGDWMHPAAGRMGQRLFEPPSVKGWEGGRRWISSTTMLVRISTVARAAGEAKTFDAAGRVARDGLRTAEDAVRLACETMLGDASPGLHETLVRTCAGPPESALRSAIAAIGSGPDYQLA